MSSAGMTIRRLGWAGLEIELDGDMLVVDLLEDTGPMDEYLGPPHAPLPPPSRSGAVAALVTHLHRDHTDPAAIARVLAPGAPLLGPRRAEGRGAETLGLRWAEDELGELGLEPREVEPWEVVEVGPYTIAAVPAVDGFGDPQVSWVIEGGGRRIFHGGDTTFHGSWWLIAMRHGPIDAAFLPINGPRVEFPHRQPPSPLPAALDPVQAAAAAHLLQAATVVPIHYDTINAPPTYVQVEKPLEKFLDAAAGNGLRALALEPGGVLELAA